jgi:filamentous hemagglutinin
MTKRRVLLYILLALTVFPLWAVYGDHTNQPPANPSTKAIMTEQRQIHILYGDETGGGHLYGAGKPCKSEFPADWDAQKILSETALIAANDNLPWRREENGYHVSENIVDGVRVRVVKGRENREVITAYPLNTGRNPCPANDNLQDKD